MNIARHPPSLGPEQDRQSQNQGIQDQEERNSLLGCLDILRIDGLWRTHRD
jgi:hypothetical protein